MTMGTTIPAEQVEGFQPPQQKRSRMTLRRIANATETLMAERGASGVTVQEVVARADTSVGSFYARFASRGAAVAFVRERSWARARELWREFLTPDDWKGVPIGAVVAEVIRRFCRILLAEGRPTRAFYLDLLQRTDEEAMQRLRQLDREVASLMSHVAEDLAEAPDRSRIREDAERGFRTVMSAARDHLLFGSDRNARELILGLGQMYAALLGAERPESYSHLLAMCATARRIKSTAGRT